MSTADEEEDTSDSATRRGTRSPRKKVAATNSARSNHSHSDESAEDTVAEHQGVYQTGKETLRKASKDLGCTVSHAIDGVMEALSHVAKHDTSHRHARRRSYRRHLNDHHAANEAEGWFHRAYGNVKHHVMDCAGTCGVSMCMSHFWQKVHDVGSSSTGFVWLTFVFELFVFLSTAYSQYDHKDGESWSSRFSFTTRWSDFLLPFFSYYVPTLLSQLFNVDRAHKIRHDVNDHHYHQTMTGLLSRTTTSGLSYFVFKFALTYLLSQHALEYTASPASRLAEFAKDAVGSAANYSGFATHHHHNLVPSHLWNGHYYAAEVFRFVPASLGLATSGTGTVLALAETVVSRRK
ncbi:MAG: hypothetical protein J3Q66DRAFT_426109 [Benniella sp.]|nr:MAG: hypothetical protein J3Q66DRAFT_426109 [Benniella sp.]